MKEAAKKALVNRLKEGREQTAKRCLAVAQYHTPPNTSVEYRKALSGRAFERDRHGRARIQAPYPVTLKSLYIYLHECGHVWLHDKSVRKEERRLSMPRYRMEYEAEMYAHEAMLAAGLEVPLAMTQRAKAYVAWKIQQAVRRGGAQFDEEALRFAEISPAMLAAWRRAYWERRMEKKLARNDILGVLIG